MRVIVCGGRDYTDGDTIRAHLAVWMLPGKEYGDLRWRLRDAAERGELTIVHGASRGADQLAGTIARGMGFRVEEHPADWRGKGRGAGPARNLAMLAAGADLVLAFPGGKGTAHMVSIARRAGVPVMEVTA